MERGWGGSWIQDQTNYPPAQLAEIINFPVPPLLKSGFPPRKVRRKRSLRRGDWPRNSFRHQYRIDASKAPRNTHPGQRQEY